MDEKNELYEVHPGILRGISDALKAADSVLSDATARFKLLMELSLAYIAMGSSDASDVYQMALSGYERCIEGRSTFTVLTEGYK